MCGRLPGAGDENGRDHADLADGGASCGGGRPAAVSRAPTISGPATVICS